MNVLEFRRYISDNSIKSVIISSANQNFSKSKLFTGFSFTLELNKLEFLNRIDTIILQNGGSSVVLQDILSINIVHENSAECLVNVACGNDNSFQTYSLICKLA